jgi:hypothetical protein
LMGPSCAKTQCGGIAGKTVELVEAPHFNHFEMLESLGNPYGPNGRAALALMKLSSAPLNDESRGESLVATAGTAWTVFPNTEGAGDTPGATGVNATEAASNAVQVVDPNEANEFDRAAADTVESSWITYVLLILGVALAAASAMWFFSGMTFLFARQAANPRMHMSNS